MLYGQRSHLLPGLDFDRVDPSLRVNLVILELLSPRAVTFENFLFEFFSLRLSGINLVYFANRNIWKEIHELTLMFTETKGFSFLKQLN